MAGLFRWYHRLPVVWHIRDMPPQGNIGKLIKRFAGSTAKALICISESVLQSMEHPSVAGRCRLVHNGVELKIFHKEEKQRIKTESVRNYKLPKKHECWPLSVKLLPGRGKKMP